MEEKEAKRLALDLLATAEAVYLATIDKEGFPQVRAVCNLKNKEHFPGLANFFEKHKDDFILYFTTSTSSEKIAQIRENPAVSAYLCNPGEFHGLMLKGRMEIATDRGIKEALWQEDWKMHYPDGIDDPEYAVLRLYPIFAKGWYQYEPFEFTLKEGK